MRKHEISCSDICGFQKMRNLTVRSTYISAASWDRLESWFFKAPTSYHAGRAHLRRPCRLWWWGTSWITWELTRGELCTASMPRRLRHWWSLPSSSDPCRRLRRYRIQGNDPAAKTKNLNKHGNKTCNFHRRRNHASVGKGIHYLGVACLSCHHQRLPKY